MIDTAVTVFSTSDRSGVPIKSSKIVVARGAIACHNASGNLVDPCTDSALCYRSAKVIDNDSIAQHR